MAKYMDREAFIEWLKHIPLKDLSDGLGLCRVIMEDDFKKAIKKIPKSIIDDVVRVVRCRDCVHDGLVTCPICYIERHALIFINHDSEFFCAYGERKEVSK